MKQVSDCGPEKCIGILGGTFDPIHTAHRNIAKDLHDALGLERVYFVPAWRNPLKVKNKMTTTPDERLAMVYLATLDMSWLYVDPVEIIRGRESGEPSYTIDTLKYFKEIIPEKNLILIVGSDNTNLHQWRGIEKFPDYLKNIAVISRPEFSTDESLYSSEIEILKEKFPDVFKIIKFFPIADYKISATEIRKSFEEGIVPGGALHPQVELFIRKYGLYGIEEAKN